MSCYITKGKRQMQEKGSALLKGNWDIKYMYKMLNQTTRLLDWSLHQAEESYLWYHNNDKGDQCWGNEDVQTWLYLEQL